ncbi:MAG: hypothetical protein ACLU41_03970 [Anaerotignum lactatifermentans]
MADICVANVLTSHCKRCGQPFMADICGANVLTLCFPSPSAFFKREKTEFLKNKLKSFSYEGFQPFLFSAEDFSAGNSLFFCHFVVFSSEKYNFIFCRLFYLYFRLVIFIVFIIKN